MPERNLYSCERVAFRREIQRLVAQELQAHYTLAESIPERHAELLKQLAQRTDDGALERSSRR